MARHCCETMTRNVERRCPDHPDRADCPDCLVGYWPESGRYGLLVHDGGPSMVEIGFCPWCGARLAGEGGARPAPAEPEAKRLSGCRRFD